MRWRNAVPHEAGERAQQRGARHGMGTSCDAAAMSTYPSSIITPPASPTRDGSAHASGGEAAAATAAR